MGRASGRKGTKSYQINVKELGPGITHAMIFLCFKQFSLFFKKNDLLLGRLTQHLRGSNWVKRVFFLPNFRKKAIKTGQMLVFKNFSEVFSKVSISELLQATVKIDSRIIDNGYFMTQKI